MTITTSSGSKDFLKEQISRDNELFLQKKLGVIETQTDWSEKNDRSVRQSDLASMKTTLENLIELKEKEFEAKLNSHIEYHSFQVLRDLGRWIGIIGIIAGTGFILVMYFLVTNYYQVKIEKIVKDSINERQCVPDRPIISSGTFCIK